LSYTRDFNDLGYFRPFVLLFGFSAARFLARVYGVFLS